MRVAFVLQRWAPRTGGSETFARDVARRLSQSHAVTALALTVQPHPHRDLTESLRPPRSFEPFEDGEIEVRPLRMAPAKKAALLPLGAQVLPGMRRVFYGRARIAAAGLYCRVVAPLIRDLVSDAEVVHMWGSDLLASATVVAAIQAGIPSVITPLAHAGEWGDDPGSARAYRRADAVVALLEAEADLYKRLGVRADRIAVSGACSPGIRPGDGPTLRERHGIDGPLVLFLGVRREYKGVDVLLEAARAVAGTRPDTAFAFVGPGRHLSHQREGPRIIDAGEVDPEERAAWLDAADLLCLPSASEIFPVSFLEAWSVGTPVLASKLPTLSELIERSGGGAVADRSPAAFAAAILQLIADPARLRALGSSGHAYWERSHTPEAAARRHELIYAGVIARRSIG